MSESSAPFPSNTPPSTVVHPPMSEPSTTQKSLSTLIEMVLDIDCDLPPGADPTQWKDQASNSLRDQYPRLTLMYREDFQFEAQPKNVPALTHSRAVDNLRFHSTDDKALVQFRALGYSFNRLAPYPGFGNLLPEIQRTWGIYCGISRPLRVKEVRQRYINRLLLPLSNGKLSFADFLHHHPTLPFQTGLSFTGFFNQHQAKEPATGCRATMVLATQPEQAKHLPLLFDITVSSPPLGLEPTDWDEITRRVQLNRDLATRIFLNTLKPSCLNPSQPS